MRGSWCYLLNCGSSRISSSPLTSIRSVFQPPCKCDRGWRLACIWQAVCQRRASCIPAPTLPRCSHLCFLVAENTLRRSDLCATRRHLPPTPPPPPSLPRRRLGCLQVAATKYIYARADVHRRVAACCIIFRRCPLQLPKRVLQLTR